MLLGNTPVNRRISLTSCAIIFIGEVIMGMLERLAEIERRYQGLGEEMAETLSGPLRGMVEETKKWVTANEEVIAAMIQILET